MMKKTISLLLLFALVLCLAAGCAKAPPAPEQTIRIGGLKGPTSLGMLKLMEDSANGAAQNAYAFTVAGSADELTPKLLLGELDMAALPANLASVLYNNTGGEIQMLAVHTLGILYIVGQGEALSGVEALRGKTVYASGKGSTPEYVLRYLFEQAGLDVDTDVTVEWKSEHNEVVAALAGAPEAYGLLPQPFVTVAESSVEGLSAVLDLTEAWDALGTGSTLVTGVLAVRKDFAARDPALLASFLDEYRASTAYTNENVPEAAALAEQYGIIKAAVAEKAIPHCNITCVTGADAKAMLEGYLAVLYAANPQAVGGALPGGDFYYGAP